MNEIVNRTLNAIDQSVDDLYTTQGLSRLLHDCGYAVNDRFTGLVKNPLFLDKAVQYGLAGIEAFKESDEILRRIASDPKGWLPDNPGQELEAGADYYAGFQGFGLNAGDVQCIMLYHQIRDNIQQIQRERGISALNENRCFCLFGSEITVPSFDWQLSVLPSDLAVLRDSGRKVFDWFMSVIPDHASRYTVSRFTDGQEIESVESSLGEIFALQSRVVLCTVYGESHDWEWRGDGYWGAPKCDRDSCDDPDNIRVTVGLDDLIVESGDATAYESFVFDRKDQSVIRYIGGPQNNV